MKKTPSLYLPIDNNHLIKRLPDESAGILFKALYEYAYSGTIPDLPNVDGIGGIFDLMRAQIDRNNDHYADTVRKRSEAGKKGGAPKGNKNARKQSVYNPETTNIDIEKAEKNCTLFDE